MMRKLKENGISLVYISHKMDEIFDICDQVSVLRDGKLVMTKDTADTNMNELITAMVGRSLDNRYPDVDNMPGEPILSINHISTKFAPYIKDISFDVREGEIFGLYGLVGAGRTELLETIFGVRTRATGRVYYRGKLMNFNKPREAIDSGFALITEERKADGLFMKGDLTFNTTIANLPAYKKNLSLSDRKMQAATVAEIRTMHTKTTGPEELISALSGGNQQKVIFGRWLEREPKVFMMDEPTRGIDVGAKYEIYELIIKMAKQGKRSSSSAQKCLKSSESQTELASCLPASSQESSIQKKPTKKSSCGSAQSICKGTAMTILTYEKEEQLLAPIKDHVGAIQNEIDTLREDGTTKVTRLQHQLRNLKADRTLTKEERANLRKQDEAELAEARRVQSKTEDASPSWSLKPKRTSIALSTSNTSTK